MQSFSYNKKKMKAIILLIFIVFVSNKIFLENKINNPKIEDIILQQSEQSLANQAKLYVDDIVDIVNNITGNIMEYFQIKINDELYTILNTKAYPHFINTLSKKSYGNLLTEVDTYLTKFFNYIKDYNYYNVIDFVVNEIKNFKEFANKTVFNTEIEHIIRHIRYEIQRLDLDEIRYNLNRTAYEVNNINVKKIIDSLKRSIEYMKRDYQERSDESRIKLEAGTYYEIGKFKAEMRYGISYVNHMIKSYIESYKIYFRSEKMLENIEDGLESFYNNAFPILKKIEVEKVISVLKYFFSTIDKTLKSNTMNEIKELIRKIIVDNKSEYLLDEFLLKVYDVIETILNMKFFEEQNVEKISNKLTEILNWAYSYVSKINSYLDFKREFYNNIQDIIKMITEYDTHYVIDINTRYVRRLFSIGIDYAKLGVKIGYDILKTFNLI